MKEFHFGNDDPGVSPEYEWVVSHYDTGDWEGSGHAVALKDGTLFVWNCGHCSCYGPLEDPPDEYKVSSLDWDDVLTLADVESDVRKKVQELLAEATQ